MFGIERPSARLWGAVPALQLIVALGVGGCSAGAGFPSWFGGSDAAPPKREFGLSRDWHVFAPEGGRARQIGPEDLVAADGRCAGRADTSSALNFQAGPEAPRAGQPAPPSPPPPSAAMPRGIALGMTECEVVGAVGVTDRVEIGTDERGERRVVLTYPQGSHPGIYLFESGRLRSIERPPNSGPPQKPSKNAGKPPPPRN